MRIVRKFLVIFANYRQFRSVVQGIVKKEEKVKMRVCEGKSNEGGKVNEVKKREALDCIFEN